MKNLNLLKVLGTIVLVIFLCSGCANIQVQSVSINPANGAVTTNSFKAVLLFSKSVAEKIDVISTTKTTTKLIGAKNVEQSGDVEMIKAVSSALGEAFAAGAKSAVKPAP